jgi:hypothetical protein
MKQREGYEARNAKGRNGFEVRVLEPASLLLLEVPAKSLFEVVMADGKSEREAENAPLNIH